MLLRGWSLSTTTTNNDFSPQFTASGLINHQRVVTCPKWEFLGKRGPISVMFESSNADICASVFSKKLAKASGLHCQSSLSSILNVPADLSE